MSLKPRSKVDVAIEEQVGRNWALAKELVFSCHIGDL